MANNTELETLTITLNAEVGNARRNLKSVATSIEELEKKGKSTDWSVFQKIKENLQDIANIDFSKVAQGLHDVVSSLKMYGIFSKNGMKSTIKTQPMGESSGNNLPIYDFSGIKPIDLGIDISKLSSIEKTFTNIDTKIENSKVAVAGAEEATDLWRRKLAECNLSISQIEKVMKDIAINKEPLTNIVDLREQLKQMGFSANDAENEIKKLGFSIGITSSEAKSASASIRSFGNELDFLSNKSRGTIPNLSKLFAQIKRIAFYRLIRRAIQVIVKAFKDGIENLAQIDKDFNKTMSNITSSITMLKNSLGAVVAPLLEALEPVIVALSTSLADMNNHLAETLSLLTGKRTFYKASMDVKDFADSLKKARDNALGIDELNIIQKDDALGGFEEMEIGKSAGDGLQRIADILGTIALTASGLAVTITLIKGGNLLDNFTNIASVLMIIGGALETISSVVDIIINGFNWADFIVLLTSIGVLILGLTLKFKTLGATIGVIVGSLALLIVGIKEMIEAWNDMGTWQKIIGVLGLVLGLVGAIFTAIGVATLNPLMIAGGAIGLITGVGSAIAVSETAKNGISFATGGFPEDGIFFANHNELVGQFSNGKTAVANNEQITTGIYEAVLQAMQDSGNIGGRSGDVVLQVDGKEIAKTTDKYNRRFGENVMKGELKYGY